MKLAIHRTVEVLRSARVLQLSGLFDLPPTERSETSWSVSLPVEEEPWQIGLIVGPSGSGKTTLVREAFPDAPFVSANTGYEWPEDRAVVDGFPEGLSIKDVTGALSSVGFSSPPAWLRPYRCLSTGEQFRATVARALVDPAGLVVLDEFTSVVDRLVAQIGSAAVSKAVRRVPAKKIVCVTCHYDVEEWLCPDWIVEMPSGTFTRRSLRRRPAIDFEVTRVHRQAWELFRQHHYLDKNINNAGQCYLATVKGQPAAFVSAMHFPHPIRSGWREHRAVCLPDFQGVGLGNAMSEFVASLYRATGKPYRSITGNPAMIRHRAKSPLWKTVTKPTLGSKLPTGKRKNAQVADAMRRYSQTTATNRLIATFEYVGPIRTAEAIGFGIV